VTEDRFVKWVQIIPTAHCCVHHSHVYVEPPDGANLDGLGLGQGSNTADEIDLIEYAAGNDVDVFADGTAKMIPAGSKFRFSSHYHPYGEETYDRQKVGIKFYPKGYQPKYVVTSHRIRNRPRQRLDLQPRTRRGPDPARRREDRHRRARDADRRAGRREPPAQRGVPQHPPEHRGAARSLLGRCRSRR
jgi:hypothetical protein